jgi:pimeloyl-ACP methyl ester carboxylesterase
MSLLDTLGIQNAHLIGISMGGAIAQLAALHHKEKVRSMTLLATSCDFRPLAAALRSEYDAKFPLPSPETPWIEWLKEVEALPRLAFFKRLKKHLFGWKILNGTKAPFPEKYYFHLLAEGIKRQRSYKSLLNHRSAVVASADYLQSVEGKISVPTLIVHGKADPLFPEEHAKHMKKQISGSRLVFFDEMGHNFCPSFHEPFFKEYQGFIQGK